MLNKSLLQIPEANPADLTSCSEDDARFALFLLAVAEALRGAAWRSLASPWRGEAVRLEEGVPPAPATPPDTLPDTPPAPARDPGKAPVTLARCVPRRLSGDALPPDSSSVVPEKFVSFCLFLGKYLRTSLDE